MDSSSYQQFRLWSGICSIGINLGMIWTAFFMSLMLPSLSAGISGILFPLVALSIALIFILAFLPFEILVGFAGESAFSRGRQSLGEWMRDWGKSQWFIIFGLVCGLCFFAWADGLPLLWKLIAVSLVCLLAAFFVFSLPFWVQLLGGMAAEQDLELDDEVNEKLRQYDAPPVKILILDDGDEEGVNGTILPFHPDTFIINHAAGEELHADELAALALREQWFHRKGQSLQCLLIVLGWLAAGLLLALTVPAAWLGATYPLQLGLGGVAVLTTWCFLALLVWPPLNNRIMLKADAYLAKKIGVEKTVALLNKIQTLNETDFDISGIKEHVFHPVPSLRRRLVHLNPKTC